MPTPGSLDALTVVSPACCLGEEKNQDRAHWSPEVGVASVCDGVTSSPHSGYGAALVSTLSPMLFGGILTERLKALSQLLVVRRLRAQREMWARAQDAEDGMQAMVMSAAMEQMASAFQTTLVAAAFTSTDIGTMAEIVRCGDSALFAFGDDGELLLSTPEFTNDETTDGPDRMPFGPGDELLVRIHGRCSDPQFQECARNLKKPANWLVCSPLDLVHGGGRGSSRTSVSRQDRLLVPVYLVGRRSEANADPYCRLRYSSTIRIVQSNQPEASIRFDSQGSVTEVLPDHVAAERWVHAREEFPAHTHFILASDGFYSAFENPSELWEWLIDHKIELSNPAALKDVMCPLHRHLQSKSGDDDMSFVWVFPRKPKDDETCPMTSQFPG